jgi:hypothetical protein
VNHIIMCCGLILALLAVPTPAAAQDESRWGIAGSFVPRWEFIQFLEDSMEREVDMEGQDFRVGIIRGRQLGGEWGVSYVQRRIEDDSIVVQQESAKCVARPGLPDVCARGTFHRTRGAEMAGVQLHRFFPLGTIARRVQIGAVLTGGVARLRGDAQEVKEHLQITVNPLTGVPTVTIGDETTMVDARQIFDDTGVADYVPLGGVEAAVALVIAPGVKLRFSGGASFPGFHTVSVTAQYLFGSR